MAYYGTPEQVSKYNGERAYESQKGRMEGLAYECYDLIASQRLNGASYVSVCNIAWYALQPLPFGKRDLTLAPNLDDGIHFGEYKEGVPGIQPERMGPYCSTFNPGYDPTLPLYRTWPLFEAIKAANAGDTPAWSKWTEIPVGADLAPAHLASAQPVYKEVFFVGANNSSLKQAFENHGVVFVSKLKTPADAIIVLDGGYVPDTKEMILIKEYINKGADSWIWSPEPATLETYQSFLPADLTLEPRKASSFLPVRKSWLENTVNSDFYFCEIQEKEVSQYGMSGRFVTEGEVLLNACRTDWRKWNKRAEEIKTAALLRSENETKGPDAVFVKYPTRKSTFYVSTIDNFTTTEKGYNTLTKILYSAGIPTEGKTLSESLIDSTGIVNLSNLFVSRQDNKKNYSLWLWSPRPLDDLLIEPDMPQLDIVLASSNEEIKLNGAKLDSYKTAPLKQGWNQVVISVPDNARLSEIQFICGNNADFVKQLQTSLQNPNK
jgi:beta-galactosidase